MPVRVAKKTLLFAVAFTAAIWAVLQSPAAQNILDVPGGQSGSASKSSNLKAAGVDRKANAAMPAVTDSETAPFPTIKGNGTPYTSSSKEPAQR
jgi:hypothetical protein